MKIVSVVGARPQFIKAAVLSRLLRESTTHSEILLHTGQHFDPQMSDIFFEELQIPEPDFNLGIGGGTHGQRTGRMLGEIESILLKINPDLIVVFGDTDSTLAGALAAAKLHIPVAHVEAGLRSFNRRMPEEINRILTDHLAELSFAPSDNSRNNLIREGISPDKIFVVGDIMHDAVLHHTAVAKQAAWRFSDYVTDGADYILATVHRAENTDDPQRLGVIFEALQETARQMPVLMPLHPRTRAAIKSIGGVHHAPAGLHLIDPVGYLDMLRLESSARLVITDSGGVQKEAYFHRRPCVTLRDETEWTELLDLGWNTLAPPTDATAILNKISCALASQPDATAHPYGRGDAAQLILKVLEAQIDSRG